MNLRYYLTYLTICIYLRYLIMNMYFRCVSKES